MLLNWEVVLSPLGYLAMTEVIYGNCKWWHVSGIKWVETVDAAKHAIELE